jgi:hypothetical protein
MDTEIILRIAAVVIALFILSTGVDYSPVKNFFTNFFKRKPKVIVPANSSVQFLDIVESWHVLRSQCEAYGLHEAVEKIDEVFPLLNGGEDA